MDGVSLEVGGVSLVGVTGSEANKRVLVISVGVMWEKEGKGVGS